MAYKKDKRTFYVRREPTNNPVSQAEFFGKTQPFDVVLYQNEDLSEVFMRFFYHDQHKPKKINKTFIIYGEVHPLIWVDDLVHHVPVDFSLISQSAVV